MCNSLFSLSTSLFLHILKVLVQSPSGMQYARGWKMDEGICYFSYIWHKGKWEGKGEIGISPSAHNFESLLMFEEGN